MTGRPGRVGSWLRRRVARGALTPALVLSLLAGCAAPPAQRTDLGGGNYVLTRRSGFAPVSSGTLKTQLERQALADCAAQGKALAVIDVQGTDPEPPAFPSAALQYRCVPI